MRGMRLGSINELMMLARDLRWYLGSMGSSSSCEMNAGAGGWSDAALNCVDFIGCSSTGSKICCGSTGTGGTTRGIMGGTMGGIVVGISCVGTVVGGTIEGIIGGSIGGIVVGTIRVGTVELEIRARRCSIADSSSGWQGLAPWMVAARF